MARKKTRTPLELARARMYYDLIFETAERIFAERGFDDATMQDLASAAGISAKTLYAAFPGGKKEIYAEIQRERGKAFIEAVREASREGSALERLGRQIRASVSFLIQHEPFRHLMQREARAWGLPSRDDPEESREAWSSGPALVADTLRQGMEEGVFHEDDPELLARTVTAVAQAQLAGRLDQAEAEPDPDRVAEEILVILRRMLCRHPEREVAPQAVA